MNNDPSNDIRGDIARIQQILKTYFADVSVRLDIDASPIDDSIDHAIQSGERLKKALSEQLKEAGKSLSQLFSLSSGVSLLVSKTQDTISELKDMDTLLTKIGRADSRLSQSDLEKLGNDAFQAAGKYGKKAADYLAAIQDASRAGYQNAAGIAELSLALQNAGDMTAELAGQYIMAADKAYGLGGSVEKLTEILDGSAHITSRNAVPMEELAAGMAAAASDAAALGVNAKDTAAALGAMIAATQQGGAKIAGAFRTILLNIRQVADGEAGITADGLAAYEAACRSLNVSLKETKNGVISLRDPMEVLKELAAEYSGLAPDDTRRTGLLDSVGGGLNAEALDALLANYGLYEKMLQEYANGTGSLAAAVEETVNSWEGSLNRLSNTWTDTIGNIADSGAITAMVNALNSLLTTLNHVTGALGPLATIGVGAGLFAGIKNVGVAQPY